MSIAVEETLLFKWPEANTFVLVRVSPEYVSLYAINSRLAFLYFHQASLPHSPPEQLSFWQRLLRPTEEERPERPKVTMEDILETRLTDMWLPVRCKLLADRGDLSVSIMSHREIILETRSIEDKRKFMNLMLFYHPKPLSKEITRPKPQVKSAMWIYLEENNMMERWQETVLLIAQLHVITRNLVSKRKERKARKEKKERQECERQLLEEEKELDLVRERHRQLNEWAVLHDKKRKEKEAQQLALQLVGESSKAC